MASTSASTGMVYTERVRNRRIIKPIVYGNMTLPLQQKNEKNHTHRWTCFVKACDRNENLSLYIRKVQFRLHESYPNNVRMVEQPPFELTETGWGEFDIQIKLYFIDVNEKPVTIFHYLRLHQPKVDPSTGLVIKEIYDEIVFNEPTEPMYRALVKHSHPKKDPKYELERQRVRDLLERGNRQIIAEIEDLKRTLRDSTALAQKYRKELHEEAGGTGTEEQQQPRSEEEKQK